MANSNEVVFGLVHGSWHGAWCWQYLQDELEDYGYRSVTVDLPIRDKWANFADYAETVKKELKSEASESEVVLVGHSRGANVIPRVAGDLAIRKLVYLCGGLDESTIGHPTNNEVEFSPPRNTHGFRQSIIKVDDSLTWLDPDWAKVLFYHDCDPMIADWALGNLRLQQRITGPPLAELPDTPAEYIICSEDRVVENRTCPGSDRVELLSPARKIIPQ